MLSTYNANKIIIEPSGMDASHCGIDDWYDDFEKQVREVLVTKKAFEASGSSKKEPLSFKIDRKSDDSAMIITVYQSMDEGIDLIYDALAEPYPDISEEQLDSLLEEMSLCEIYSETSAKEIIDGDSAIDDIKDVLNDLINSTDKELEGNYQSLKGILKEHGYAVTK